MVELVAFSLLEDLWHRRYLMFLSARDAALELPVVEAALVQRRPPLAALTSDMSHVLYSIPQLSVAVQVPPACALILASAHASPNLLWLAVTAHYLDLFESEGNM